MSKPYNRKVKMQMDKINKTTLHVKGVDMTQELSELCDELDKLDGVASQEVSDFFMQDIKDFDKGDVA